MAGEVGASLGIAHAVGAPIALGVGQGGDVAVPHGEGIAVAVGLDEAAEDVGGLRLGAVGIIGAEGKGGVGGGTGFGEPDGFVVDAEAFHGGGEAGAAHDEGFPVGIVVVVDDVEPVLAAACDDAGEPGVEGVVVEAGHAGEEDDGVGVVGADEGGGLREELALLAGREAVGGQAVGEALAAAPGHFVVGIGGAPVFHFVAEFPVFDLVGVAADDGFDVVAGCGAEGFLEGVAAGRPRGRGGGVLHVEEGGDGDEAIDGDDGIGVGEGPLVVGGFDEVPEEVGLDELAVGGGAEGIEVAEDGGGLVCVGQVRGGCSAAALVPEEADEVEADLGAGEGVEFFGQGDGGEELAAGEVRTVVGVREACEGRPRAFGGRDRPRARLGRGERGEGEGEKQRKKDLRVHGQEV